jgi:hypothetical protein
MLDVITAAKSAEEIDRARAVGVIAKRAKNPVLRGNLRRVAAGGPSRPTAARLLKTLTSP